jgi:hypothetical protein
MAGLPLQLVQTLPEPAAASVSQLCEMAPGIPWTNQILDDMVEALKDQPCIPSQLTLSLPVNGIMSSPVGGITKFEAFLFCARRKVKKEMKTEIRAVVNYYCGVQNQHGIQCPARFEKTFPMDRTGIKKAIEFLQASVQNLKRKGLCETCMTREPPLKCLRVGGSGFCSSCVLQKALFE